MSIVGEDPAIIAPLLRAIFRRFDQALIPWAALRGAERLPEYTRRDVDLLVHRDHMHHACQAVRDAAKETGWVCITEFIDPPQHTFILLLPGGRGHFLPIELFSDQHCHGLRVSDGDVGLRDRYRIRPEVWVVRPGFSAASTAIKEVVPHGTLKESARDYVQRGARDEPALFLESIQDTLGRSALTQQTLEACQNGEWQWLEQHASQIRRTLWRRMRLRDWKRMFHYYARMLIYRVGRRRGVLAVLLGPDGSGKTTIAEQLLQEIQSRPFSPVRLCKGDFGILPRLKQFKVFAWRMLGRRVEYRQAPPGTRHIGMGKPNPPLRSMVYVAYYSVDLLLGRLTLRRWRFAFHLFDRYYYDYYYMQAHSRVPRWYLRLMEHLVPRPEIIFYLQRDAEAIYAQKPELTVEEIRRQQKAIVQLLEGRPEARIIDAGDGVEATVLKVRAIINEFLADRGRS